MPINFRSSGVYSFAGYVYRNYGENLFTEWKEEVCRSKGKQLDVLLDEFLFNGTETTPNTSL